MYNILRYLIVFTFLFFISFKTFSHGGATGIVKERMDNFQMSKSIMREINKSLNIKDFKNIENGAKKLQAWGEKMGTFFPEGSNIKPSEAREDIWLEPDLFKKAINNFTEASKKLAFISKENDLENSISAFRELANTCKGCHKQFRN